MMSFRRPDADLATLMVVYRQPEARVVVSMLQARGIAAFTPDWGVATVMPHLTLAFGGIAVLVPARDLVDAHDLVAGIDDVVPPRVFRGGWAWNVVLLLGLCLLMAPGVPPPRLRRVLTAAR